MTKKSWHIDRRRMLRGMGTTLALPMLDGMAFGAQKAKLVNSKARMCSIYFPYGVQMSGDLKWFPDGEGANYTFSKPLEVLQPHKNDFTVFGGLSHPKGRKMNGHTTADNFLTGAYIKSNGTGQTVSLDTIASMSLGQTTRYSSLVLSTDEGVGEIGRRHTTSTTLKGRVIPPLVSPLKIYEHLFGEVSAASRLDLQRKKSLLDALLEDVKALNRNLGAQDKEKLDEYLTSVRDTEKKVLKTEEWLGTPKPRVDSSSLMLDVVPSESPELYLQTMFDLMFLALQTNSTRVMTYSIGNMKGGMAESFASIVTDDKRPHHAQAHKNSTGQYDAFLAKQLEYFVAKLKNAREGESSLLENTMVLFGSSNSKTHVNTNYPLILAGGSKLGLKHGRYLKYTEKTPLSNLYLTMLQGLGVQAESFSDSNGVLSELT